MSAFQEILSHVLMCMIGLAAAGAAHSLYKIVIRKRPSFTRQSDDAGFALVHVVLMMFAGPLVLTRNAMILRKRDNKPIGWLAASSTIAAAWCLLSGVFVLTLIRYASGGF